jgi:hypothetical protein
MKNWFDEPYRRYNNIAKIAIIFVIIAIIVLFANLQSNIDLPSWLIIFIVFLAFAGVILFIFAAIQGFRLMYKGKAYDEREKKILGRATFYGMIITIVLSILLSYLIDYLGYELTVRTLIMIPIAILCASSGILYWYFNKKGDVK